MVEPEHGSHLELLKDPGADSISHKMSYCKISQSLQGMRLMFRILHWPWNLAVVSAAMLLRHLWHRGGSIPWGIRATSPHWPAAVSRSFWTHSHVPRQISKRNEHFKSWSWRDLIMIRCLMRYWISSLFAWVTSCYNFGDCWCYKGTRLCLMSPACVALYPVLLKWRDADVSILAIAAQMFHFVFKQRLHIFNSWISITQY